MSDDSTLCDQIAKLQQGELTLLPQLFDAYRQPLREMVRMRLGSQLAARIDPSDVLQETYVDASHKIHQYVQNPRVSFFIWLRGLTQDRLLKLQRQHVGAQQRSVTMEVSLLEDASDALAAAIPTPGRFLMQAELQARVQAAVQRLKRDDCELILMRHFEGLSNAQVAEALGLSPSAATMRHGRALARLKELLKDEIDSSGIQS